MKMKEIPLLFIVLVFQIGTMLQSCNTQKKAQNSSEFTIQVAGKSFEGKNVELDTEQAKTAVRSAGDVATISKHLYYIAYSANFAGKVYEAAKDETKFLQALWKVIPLVLSDLPNLINAGNSFKTIGEFYKASGGLTLAEKAAVVDQFSLWLNIPIEDADGIVTAAIDAALANMALANKVQHIAKPKEAQ